MALKCKVKAKDMLVPVEGTESDGKGTCPVCLTPERKLTQKGYVGAHNVVVPEVDATVPTTDEGLRIGAPRDAAVKRALEGRQISAQRQPVPTTQTSDVAVALRGPTLVQGRDVAPRLRDPGQPWLEGTDLRQDGTVRKSTTLELPRGRDRFDRKITDVPEPPEPPRKRTHAERRRYRRAQLERSSGRS